MGGEIRGGVLPSKEGRFAAGFYLQRRGDSQRGSTFKGGEIRGGVLRR